MPHPKHNRRPDVIDKALANGWSHDPAQTKHGAISDQFTRGKQTLTCFWCETPWSDARWENGVLVGGERPRQVWRIEGENGVLSILAKTR
jgi:hypothetical protein